jgi:hypothetical protein
MGKVTTVPIDDETSKVSVVVNNEDLDSFTNELEQMIEDYDYEDDGEDTEEIDMDELDEEDD